MHDAQGSRRLRVLLIIDHLSALGGAERFVTGLACHLPRERVEPWVCSTRQADQRAVRMLTDAGVPHLNLGRSTKWQVHRLHGLVALLRRHRFDVLHANMFGSNVWGTLIGRACGVPVVLAHEHTWSFQGLPARKWIDGNVIGRLATRCLAVSAADRERMIALEGVPAHKVLVMPIPHIPHGPARAGDIRSELGLPAVTPLIFVAAEFRPQKALDVLLDAHARLLAQVSDAHLVLAGDGPCRPQLEAQIDRLGIGRSVHLLGYRDDVDAILRAVDTGVLSSDYEGMPMFAAECIDARTPLVATAVGGLTELVDHGRTGLLVPPRDADALAAALRTVITDRALAARLAAEAAARSVTVTVHEAALAYADLYEQLVRRHRGAQRMVAPVPTPADAT